MGIRIAPSSLIPFMQFPLRLTTYMKQGSCVKTEKLILLQHCQLNHTVHLYFTIFPLIFFSCSSSQLCCIFWHVLFISSGLCIEGGHGEVVSTGDPGAGLGQLEAPHSHPCPWNVCSAHCSHSWSLFKGCSLERVMCCWGRLQGIRN